MSTKSKQHFYLPLANLVGRRQDMLLTGAMFDMTKAGQLSFALTARYGTWLSAPILSPAPIRARSPLCAA